jgi:hypothetical protein
MNIELRVMNIELNRIVLEWNKLANTQDEQIVEKFYDVFSDLFSYAAEVTKLNDKLLAQDTK